MAEGNIKIGNKAPAFTLEDQHGDKVALKDLAGQWVVLYFYPKDDTPGCTKEACQFTESIKSFEKLNATVFGVSPDDAPSHRKFIDKFKLKVDLLCDPRRRMMPKYDAWGEKNMYGKITEGVIRSTVIVDPDGRVAHHWKRVQADGHAAQVKTRLEALQAA
ncbi:MAG: peroxiredoxin [Phycisphaeraceae bacterium]|nr:peroxiredoxin [Phycisphaeraceae bacterium]